MINKTNQTLHTVSSAKEAELLLDKGADIDSRDETGSTPLQLACENGRFNLALFLLEKNASPTAKDAMGRSPLSLCNNDDVVKSDRGVKVVEALLSGNVDPDDLLYPLYLNFSFTLDRIEEGERKEAKDRLDKIVRLLLDKGANVTEKPFSDSEDPFLLYEAACRADFVNVERFLESGADPNQKDKYGFTPLHFLKSNGAPVKSYISGKKDIYSAMEETVSLLLDAGANAKARDILGNTPLHYCCGSSPVSVLKALVGANADVNARNKEGKTPLHELISSIEDKFSLLQRHEIHEAMKFLLDKGANPNRKDKDGVTPMHLFAKFPMEADAEKIWEKLVFAGGKVSTKNKWGETPLHSSLAIGLDNLDLDTVSFLINQGADINAHNIMNATPLHYATLVDVDYGKFKGEVVAKLIDAGANLTAQDKTGDTPFHLALAVPNLGVIEKLVDAFDNKDFLMIENNNGISPFTIISRKGTGFLNNNIVNKIKQKKTTFGKAPITDTVDSAPPSP